MHPLRSAAPLIVYMDFKSPYAYLAKDPTWQLEADFGIAIDWRPLTLNIPSFLGSAKVNDAGKVVEENRTPRQWQGVRYAYQDAKRYARLKDILIYGPKKIWDSSLASIGMLWTRQADRAVLRSYMDIVYERFWRRDLDIEDPDVVAGVVAEAGGDASGFREYLADAGRREHDELQSVLHPAGLFGVPSYVIDGEVFFGREHLPAVRWMLGGRQGPPPDIAYDRFESP
ncbi:MAG: 2-hydroxychromene-2-carboxylate isomerase [Gammaproteobacteria bacterium]|nr:2-hydroxychromene-2-carboxylate isomerase [Gammaproteobacteria bacterium]